MKFEKITDSKDLSNIKDNKFLGVLPNLKNSCINFSGKNNVLVCEKNVTLENTNIYFNGENSLIYLSSNKNFYQLNVDAYNNNVLFIGKDNYFNGIINIILSEEKNVIIGNECLFSKNVWLRVADPHLIYNIEDKLRINFSKSIFIGDHVWVEQNATLLKGTCIGSDSILAANTVISNKTIFSNSTWGGNPCKVIKKQIFWDGSCVHNWTKEKTQEMMYNFSDKYIFQKYETQLLFMDIEKNLLNNDNTLDKLAYIKMKLNKANKNRFYIENIKEKKLKIFKNFKK